VKRVRKFERNEQLEMLLSELNLALKCSNKKFHNSGSSRWAKVFIMGPFRSGTTLIMQWLAKSGLVAYPTNLLSRFYGAPLVGAKIQQLLTDPAYNYRNEILDFDSEIDFHSENGKTIGALAPNEFWYFWRRFLPFKDLDYAPDSQFLRNKNFRKLKTELDGLTCIFEKPFALKAMIMNQNIRALNSIFDRAIFVWMKRDPVSNIQSALRARQRQYGNMQTWYSFKIKEYPILNNLDPLLSVAGQIYATNQSLEQGFDNLDDNSKILVNYEDFCRRPEFYYNCLQKKIILKSEGVDRVPYAGPDSFASTNSQSNNDYSEKQIKDAYKQMADKLTGESAG
jgi:hypothetical protein